ncbi:MAG: CapA family protein [Candidatus Nealsonbacteria bacterium]|nr:CapA family protein [Candidatus Nealsonbacteria bacterium]
MPNLPWKKISFTVFGFILGTFLFLGNSAFSFLIKPTVIDIAPLPAQVSKNLAENLPESQPKEISLILTGDIMLNRRVDLMMKAKNDYTFPFQKIAEKLNEADIVFGNLENPISDKGKKTGSIYSFRADPKSVEGLIFAGFDVLSLANNHSFDYGKIALEDTFSRLKAAGINYVGAGFNGKEAFSPIIKEVDGTKIGFLAYSDLGSVYWTATENSSGLALISLEYFENIKQDIRKAKSQVDILIVSLHSGEEYIKEPGPQQINFAKAAIDEGADIIVGHHPHIVQKNEIFKNKYIFYSLGNFVFDQNFSPETMEGQIIKVAIENKKIKEVIPINIKINQYLQPEVANAQN